MIEEGCDETTGDDRDRPADDGAGDRDTEAAADNQPEHVATLRTERDANAKLVTALRHVVRDHRVEADRGKEQRESAEQREHRCAKPPGSHVRLEDLRHWRHRYV